MFNFKDSGVNVVVGLYSGSKFVVKVEGVGLKVLFVVEVVKVVDLIMIFLFDEV